MKRRDLLKLGLAGVLMPAFIHDSFAASVANSELIDLSDAWRAAGELGKPVLFLVIPEDEGERWAQGRAFGAWLNNASEKSLAQLALCEVVCARPSQIETLVPDIPAGAFFVLADPRQFPVEPRIASPKLPDPYQHNSWEQDGRKAYERAIDVQIQMLEKALSDVVKPFVPDEFGARRARLASEARARYVQKRITGSHWASSYGCGTDIEGYDEMYAVGCGMGHVSEKATRFLYFFDPDSGYI